MQLGHPPPQPPGTWLVLVKQYPRDIDPCLLILPWVSNPLARWGLILMSSLMLEWECRGFLLCVSRLDLEPRMRLGPAQSGERLA